MNWIALDVVINVFSHRSGENIALKYAPIVTSNPMDLTTENGKEEEANPTDTF